jgi:hypothetical protein
VGKIPVKHYRAGTAQYWGMCMLGVWAAWCCSPGADGMQASWASMSTDSGMASAWASAFARGAWGTAEMGGNGNGNASECLPSSNRQPMRALFKPPALGWQSWEAGAHWPWLMTVKKHGLYPPPKAWHHGTCYARKGRHALPCPLVSRGSPRVQVPICRRMRASLQSHSRQKRVVYN